jgi:hypothetical protein
MASRTLPAGADVPAQRKDAERDLCLAGLAAMLDPPRPEVPAAIERVHHAGIRVHVVTGDNGLTAAAIAKSVGIGAGGMRVVSGTELDAMTEDQLDRVLSSGTEIVFARSSPEAKLRGDRRRPPPGGDHVHLPRAGELDGGHSRRDKAGAPGIARSGGQVRRRFGGAADHGGRDGSDPAAAAGRQRPVDSAAGTGTGRAGAGGR